MKVDQTRNENWTLINDVPPGTLVKWLESFYIVGTYKVVPNTFRVIGVRSGLRNEIPRGKYVTVYPNAKIILGDN